MTVIHANFGRASAPPETTEPRRSVLDLSAHEIADSVKGMIDGVVDERGQMTRLQRLARAEELVECAERHIATGGLINLEIASSQILSARIMGARD